MTLEDVKKKGMLSEIVKRLSDTESSIRQLLSKSPALPGAKVRSSANQSIPNAAWTALIFNTVVFDYGAFWNVANPSRLTISVPGIYYLGGLVAYAANTTNSRWIAILVNGTTYIALESTSATNVGNTDRSIATINSLIAGDYVEIVVYQDSGGALNSVVTAGQYSPVGLIQRLS